MIEMGYCVMFTRHNVHKGFCSVCGFHEVTHTLPQNEGMDTPKLELPVLSVQHLADSLDGRQITSVEAVDMVAGPMKLDVTPVKLGDLHAGDRLIKEVPQEEYERKMRSIDANMAKVEEFMKEKKMVAYNKRESTIKKHEYVLPSSVAAGEVQVAITHARRDKEAAGYEASFMDSVMIGVADEEIIVYWEESAPE